MHGLKYLVCTHTTYPVAACINSYLENDVDINVSVFSYVAGSSRSFRNVFTRIGNVGISLRPRETGLSFLKENLLSLQADFV